MNNYDVLNELFVKLFNDILDIEEKVLITSEFKNISVNDMHIIEAIGMDSCRNMSSVARIMSVTVGTLTIAINSLVKKGYVNRVRSEEDRRVVLISLSTLGEKVFAHHKKFHDEMIQAALGNLNSTEAELLAKALQNLQTFFGNYNGLK